MIAEAVNYPVATLPPAGNLTLAMNALADLIDSQRAGDENYFFNQRARYARTIGRIQELCPTPCRVLDIGSHYLHQSVLLSNLGYDVSGMDIELFTNAPFVQQRARCFNIKNNTVNILESGDFLYGQEERFDLIVFTEILEHITFNPIRFWQRVYHLLSPQGIVYLSTPNSLRPMAWVRELVRLLTFQGIGLSVKEILSNVTYGHHWKEYSAREIKLLFACLSSDFLVDIGWYSSDLENRADFATRVKKMLALVPCFRSDIEAVIRRSGNSGVFACPPQLKMSNRPGEAQLPQPPSKEKE